jgi:hypothetical protein
VGEATACARERDDRFFAQKSRAPQRVRGSQIQAGDQLFLGRDGARATALRAIILFFGSGHAARVGAGLAVCGSLDAATGDFGGGSVFLGISRVGEAEGEGGTDDNSEQGFLDFHSRIYLS